MKLLKLKSYRLPAAVFVFVALNLMMIQVKVDYPMLLFERFFKKGGWLELFIVALFGAFLAFKMQDPNQSARWRKISWTIFSIWFFAQLLIGITLSETFLLTGKLHLPVPAMLICGPLYRGEKSVMTILFLSTILLTGPAWCSQLCYFGAIDHYFAKGKTKRSLIKYKFRIKHILLLFMVMVTLCMQLLNVKPLVATVIGSIFGIIGILTIVIVTRKQHRMIHCSVFCPIGTIVNYLKFINPFRMFIDKNCDRCMACSLKCKYDALRGEDIKRLKPGVSCTYCGDCISSCKSNSIKYRFFKISPEKARRLYLFITVSVYAIFLAMGRI